MKHELGRLECRICGGLMYFPLMDAALRNGDRLIELTCSRGHTDSYWDLDNTPVPEAAEFEPARAAVVGF